MTGTDWEVQATPLASRRAKMAKWIKHAGLGIAVGLGLGVVLGGLTCVAYSGGFSWSAVVQRLGNRGLGDFELGASLGVLPGGTVGLWIGLLAVVSRRTDLVLSGLFIGASMGCLFGIHLGDLVAHLHGNPIRADSAEYYRLLAYYGVIGAVPGAAGGLLIARAMPVLKRR